MPAAEDEGPKDGWTRSGNFTFLFNQAAFNAEWLGGGTSNIAGNVSISYNFNYRKGKLTWDNKIIGDYGLTKTKDQDFTRKTNDRLEFNSLVGSQINESNWYYSGILNFRTQFTTGYTFGTDAQGNETRTALTKFLSPAYVQLGPGLLWKKNDNLKVNISPASARFIFVSSEFTDNLLVGETYFGVDPGDTFRFELGAFVQGYAKFDLWENVAMENILNLYSNYLEDPQNVDVDYTANIIMTINKYLSANIAFQAIYDDNAIGAFQIREAFGLGLNYGF